MSAEGAIRSLMNAYCRAIDGGDMQAFGRLFRGADWLVEGRKPGPGSDHNLILYSDGTPRTKHVITNIEILVDEDAGTATGHSYVTVYQQPEGRGLTVIFVGEYVDEFAKSDNVWRFMRRDIRNPLYGDLSAHLKNPQATFPAA